MFTLVTHVCGHPGSRNIAGSANHRDLLARAYSERPCADCIPDGDLLPRALLRAIERAEIESRWLPPLSGTPDEAVGASALRACFVLALERYRTRGLIGPPGDELEALLRETLAGNHGEWNLRFAVVSDWLQERGLETERRGESLDLFAWHLGRIRLSEERTAESWLTPYRGAFSGPLDRALEFFARIDRPPRLGRRHSSE